MFTLFKVYCRDTILLAINYIPDTADTFHHCWMVYPIEHLKSLDRMKYTIYRICYSHPIFHFKLISFFVAVFDWRIAHQHLFPRLLLADQEDVLHIHPGSPISSFKMKIHNRRQLENTVMQLLLINNIKRNHIKFKKASHGTELFF